MNQSNQENSRWYASIVEQAQKIKKKVTGLRMRPQHEDVKQPDITQEVIEDPKQVNTEKKVYTEEELKTRFPDANPEHLRRLKEAFDKGIDIGSQVISYNSGEDPIKTITKIFDDATFSFNPDGSRHFGLIQLAEYHIASEEEIKAVEQQKELKSKFPNATKDNLKRLQMIIKREETGDIQEIGYVEDRFKRIFDNPSGEGLRIIKESLKKGIDNGSTIIYPNPRTNGNSLLRITKILPSGSFEAQDILFPQKKDLTYVTIEDSSLATSESMTQQLERYENLKKRFPDANPINLRDIKETLDKGIDIGSRVISLRPSVNTIQTVTKIFDDGTFSFNPDGSKDFGKNYVKEYRLATQEE